MAGEIVHLTDLAELDAFLAQSHNAPMMLYKHSNACMVCLYSRKAFEETVARCQNDPVGFGFVEVRRSRAVSTEAARRLDVRHESPQIILVVQGKAVWDASHGEITLETLEAALHDRAR